MWNTKNKQQKAVLIKHQLFSVFSSGILQVNLTSVTVSWKVQMHFTSLFMQETKTGCSNPVQILPQQIHTCVPLATEKPFMQDAIKQ